MKTINFHVFKAGGHLGVYGGEGSGNFGHEGRPGEIGGSGEGGGESSIIKDQLFITSNDYNLYHGTDQDFEEFNNDFIGSGDSMGYAGEGFYFTSDKG